MHIQKHLNNSNKSKDCRPIGKEEGLSNGMRVAPMWIGCCASSLLSINAQAQVLARIPQGTFVADVSVYMYILVMCDSKTFQPT